ncbi:putative 3',5'-cyclic phosphodiesterase pde-5 [Hypsibius exemplaris]|uniref:3',5'-cyclic phosphodiesterase pde-5 n=1 Tax=Hypsibius exemplaris TaxID=2072580 RepID=A0A1W0WFS5_HYPEX|nr:putative 3',5'-cyclic phosphodiesterase pde-5 [Hypsibius exemplaris]
MITPTSQVPLAPPPRLLEFLDFNPKITDRTTLEGRTKYDKFSSLIERVNIWLAKNPLYDLIAVETVQVSGGEPIPEVALCQKRADTARSLATHPVTNQTPCNYIRGVRIWLRHNPIRSPAWEQTVKYITVVPNLRLQGNPAEYVTGGPEELFAAANQFVTANKIRGRYLGAETFSLYLSSDKPNPEMTAWSVGGTTCQQYVEALRVLYLADPNATLDPTLGFVDLLPGSLSGGGDGRLLASVRAAVETLDNEPFHDKALSKPASSEAPGNTDRLMAMAANWQKSHPECKILRFQTYLKRHVEFPQVAIWPRLIDDIVQASTGIRLIHCGTKCSPTVPDLTVRSELFVPKICYEISFLRRTTIRHETQAKLMERIAEWAQYSNYNEQSFEICFYGGGQGGVTASRPSFVQTKVMYENASASRFSSSVKRLGDSDKNTGSSNNRAKLTDSDLSDIAPDKNRPLESEPIYRDDFHASRATQTVGKVPKVYLTQAWKYTKMPGSEERSRVDFRHSAQIGTMRGDLHGPCVPDGVNIDQLEQEPSFLRVLHENINMSSKTMADNFDGVTRLQMAVGNFELNRTVQTDIAVDNIPFAKDDLWFVEDPQNVEAEMMGNKPLVKEFVKSSGVFSSRDLYLMLQSRKARRKPIEGLIHRPQHERSHAGLDHAYKEADIHTIEQYDIASDRHEDFLQPLISPSDAYSKFTHSDSPSNSGAIGLTNVYALPPESILTEAIPELADFKDPSIENLSDSLNEIFHYAKRQKNLLNADSMVFYTVKKIDGPIIGLEKYPPRQTSQYIHSVSESLQYGIEVKHTSKVEVESCSIDVGVAPIELIEDNQSPKLFVTDQIVDGILSPSPTALSSLSDNCPEPHRATILEESVPTLELTIDLRNTRDLLTQVLIQQTWFRIVNLRGFLGHGYPFIPGVPDTSKSAIIIPVGLHDGRLLGFITFVRWGKKPNFTEAEAEVTFSQTCFMLRHRYYAGVRNEQRKTEMKLLREMHSVLRMQEPAVDEFLHLTLMLSRALTDADRASCFLVNNLTEALSLQSELIPYHLETGAMDSITGKPSYRKGHDIRMSVNHGIVGCAYRHRRTYASAGTQDDKHFFSDIDRVLANRTESLVCVPFMMGDKPYGLVEVLNKKSSSQFAEQDIKMLHLSSVFPALGILLTWYRFNSNKQEYLIGIMRAKTSYMRNRRLHRATRLWRPHEIPKYVPDLPEITLEMEEPQFFYLDHLPDMTVMATELIKELFPRHYIDLTILWNFVVHVKNYHFRSRYKDWRYAFASLQAIYAIIKKSGDLFNVDDKLSLAVAAIGHGVDHFCFNGAISEGTDLPSGLAHVFGDTAPEVTTVYSLVVLLQERSTNVFHMYHNNKWCRLKDSILKCVMATQIPTLLQRTAELQALVEEPGFKKEDSYHKQLIKEFVTAAASLNFAHRTPELFQEISRCAMEEFGQILEELSMRPGGSFCPRWAVPADPQLVKTAQIDLLKRVCLPVFSLLKTLFPGTHKFYDGCVQNLEKLPGLSSKRLDQISGVMSNAEPRGKDRHVNADMKSQLRRSLFEQMNLPLDHRDVQWQALEDIPHFWHDK